MLFNLSNEAKFKVNLLLVTFGGDAGVLLPTSLEVQPHHIVRLNDRLEPDVHQQEEYCVKLRSMMGLNTKALSVDLLINWVPSQPNHLKVRLQNEDQPLLSHLKRLTGGGAKVVVRLTFSKTRQLFQDPMSLQTKEMEINLPDKSKEHLYEKFEAFCEDTVFHDGLKEIFRSGYLHVKAQTQFVVADTFINDEKNAEEQLMKKCKYILTQKINTDASIVAANGTVFEFNKCFLIPHSKVFSAMFDGSFQEAKSSQVKWDTVSADCVEVLLEYIYTFGLGKALSNSTLAVELFYLAHLYEIKSLEETLVAMFLLRGAEWFELEAALDLFSLTCKIEKGVDRLKTKMAEVVKLKPGSLEKSGDVKEVNLEEWLAVKLTIN